MAYRLQPYLRLAYDSGAISDRSLFERVCNKIADDAPEPPSRIHGDLWSGNVVWTGQGAHLIDPAAHGGHRETDLAMLALFGLPQLERVLAAYDEAHPLAAGWRERVGLHQLHPLLVHVVLFGGSYVGRAVAVAEPLRVSKVRSLLKDLDSSGERTNTFGHDTTPPPSSGLAGRPARGRSAGDSPHRAHYACRC